MTAEPSLPLRRRTVDVALEARVRRWTIEERDVHLTLADPLTVAWPNHEKLFFNSKGVAAHTTDICAHYPPADQSVWNW